MTTSKILKINDLEVKNKEKEQKNGFGKDKKNIALDNQDRLQRIRISCLVK
jgi:phosphopantothenoylcysteine synthetase/decarboxylase